MDVGLSGVRAAVLDEDGRLLAASRRPLRPRLGRGRAELDPVTVLEAVLDAGGEAVRGSDGVEVVAICALGPAPILVDGSLEPLTPALLFSLDRRAEAESERLGTTHDHALPKLLWWREHEPELWRRAAVALDVTGFLVARLTGRPIQDTITRADYEHATEPLPLPLGDSLEPLEQAGGLGAEIARALGLAAGTPVVAGTYDTYADLVAAGVRHPGDACVLLGSTLVIGCVVAERIDCPGLELSSYPGAGLFLGGWTATAGAALDWFRRELGAVDEVHGLEPGAGGLLVLPYLAGERSPVWDPQASGVVVGLTLATTRAEIYRALVDGIALSARDHVERLRAVGLEPARWRASGGGTRDATWLRATCDAIGAPLDVVAHAGDAVGPAVLALQASGVDVSLPVVEEVTPDSARSARFDELYTVYRELYPATAPVLHRLTRSDA
ncbi:MAG: xylulokinase [Gaiellaceae bacterium]